MMFLPLNNAYATQRTEKIEQTFRVNYGSAEVFLTNTSNKLEIESKISGQSLEKINGTVYLERYTYGGWVSLKSWSISGNGTAILTETYSSSSGGLYRARLSATVNGERISAVSDSVRL